MTPSINNNSNLPASTSGPLSNSVSTKGNARTKEVAREFEALFTSLMVRSMRKSVTPLESDFIQNSLGEKIYTEMLDDEYGNLMASGSGLGLADIILKQMGDDDSNASSLTMLKSLKGNASWMLDKQFIPTSSAAYQGTTTDRVNQWQSIITEASQQYGVDKNLIAAVIAQESSGNQYAVSPKGAKGLMQLMDSTARYLGVSNVFQPRQNILGGTKYLRQLLDKYNGNETLALASYNAGPAAVDKYNGIPPYDETQRYVGSVLSLKNQFTTNPGLSQGDTDHE